MDQTVNLHELLISEVQIIPVKPKNGLVAFTSCVINNSLYIGNIAIYSSPTATDGYRLVYPQKVLPNGKEINCVHPINREAGDVITKAIIQNYRDLLSEIEINRFQNLKTCRRGKDELGKETTEETKG